MRISENANRLAMGAMNESELVDYISQAVLLTFAKTNSPAVFPNVVDKLHLENKE